MSHATWLIYLNPSHLFLPISIRMYVPNWFVSVWQRNVAGISMSALSTWWGMMLEVERNRCRRSTSFNIWIPYTQMGLLILYYDWSPHVRITVKWWRLAQIEIWNDGVTKTCAAKLKTFLIIITVRDTFYWIESSKEQHLFEIL